MAFPTSVKLSGEIVGNEDMSPQGSNAPLTQRVDGQSKECDANWGFEVEEVPGQPYEVATSSLRRELSPRDLNMIAFSGSVGTGLIVRQCVS